MFAELSTSLASAMSPITTCSVLEFTTNSPVHVMDFTGSDSTKKTAVVVIPKDLLPNLRDNSLASALAKGVTLTSSMETATFSCTADSSVSLSSVLTEDEECTTTSASSSKRRRAIFSPYWKNSDQQPLELIPTGDTDEVEAIRASAAATDSLQSWPQREIQALQRRPNKPRVVKSDTALSRSTPLSILRKSKYGSSASGACRRHTTTGTKSDLEATRIAIAGALATLESPRVKFNSKVDVRLFSKERPMEEKAEPGWSKMFTD
ncbi:MAG: hypothetical protein SGBAC_004538 [Bacillariaceae sp.]